jgi:hypothetical protein
LRDGGLIFKQPGQGAQEMDGLYKLIAILSLPHLQPHHRFDLWEISTAISI